MVRTTCAVPRHKRHKKVIKMAKGYYGRRKNCYRIAKNAVDKGLQYAYIHRRTKKRDFRSLWIQRLNAAARMRGLKYSTLWNMLTKAKIGLNRKMLSEIAIHKPEFFDQIVAKTQG